MSVWSEKFFKNVYEEYSFIEAFFITIIFIISLLSLLINALQIFMPFTYIAF